MTLLDVLELVDLDRGRRSTLAGSSGSIPSPSSPMARTLCDWLPRVRMSPPTFAFELRDRVLDLLERDVVLPQQPRVDQHLVLLDRAAVARHVDHAGDRLERAVEHPVLHRLELVQGVARALRARSGRSRRWGSRGRARADARRAGCRPCRSG